MAGLVLGATHAPPDDAEIKWGLSVLQVPLYEYGFHMAVATLDAVAFVVVASVIVP
jgi:hypothetical protein